MPQTNSDEVKRQVELIKALEDLLEGQHEQIPDPEALLLLSGVTNRDTIAQTMVAFKDAVEGGFSIAPILGQMATVEAFGALYKLGVLVGYTAARNERKESQA